MFGSAFQHKLQSSQPISNSEILPASDLQPMSSSVISLTSSSQVSSICLMCSQPILNSEILSASGSQVPSICFAYSNSEILQTSVSPVYLIHPQPILDNEVSPVFGLQVSPIYSIQQENTFVNSGISDMNKDLNINKNSDMNKDSNIDKDQNIEFTLYQLLLDLNLMVLPVEGVDMPLVNATCPKSTEKIKITSCYLEYTNYEIHPDTTSFAPYYWQFPE
ncbi:2473_t:CDS:2 [Dentiscutata erythropus]|uniref:2473_t:CDS:1 n=1 Tax=Dentiscutata erythropus TaxID=1348616 RepID=A0A9N9HN63_9GLOM|nr:2473_t:CDS:2 [Dentiscutata erythropus]